MIRRPLVNEQVRAFAYGCKHRTEWPAVIFGNIVPPYSKNDVHAAELLPFIVYAIAHAPNYVFAMGAITMFAGWMRTFNYEERDYAVKQLEKHYGIRIGQIEPDLSQFRGDFRQELPEASELLQRDQLFDAGEPAFLPEEVSAYQSEGGEWW